MDAPPPDHTGAYVAAGIAIAVAILAAVTAQRRLRQQLAHDRELRDLEALRAVLDESASALAEATLALARLVRLWSRRVPDEDPRVSEASAAQRASVRAVRAAIYRLAMRLPSNDPVVQKFEQTYSALDVIAGLQQRLAPNEPYEQWYPQIQEASQRVEEHRQRFLEAAREKIGPAQSD